MIIYNFHIGGILLIQPKQISPLIIHCIPCIDLSYLLKRFKACSRVELLGLLTRLVINHSEFFLICLGFPLVFSLRILSISFFCFCRVKTLNHIVIVSYSVTDVNRYYLLNSPLILILLFRKQNNPFLELTFCF